MRATWYDAGVSMSIPTSNTFSTRNAIVPERSARPLSNADSAGRDTPSAAAAPATVSPSGSIASVLMKAPGCGDPALERIEIHVLDAGAYRLAQAASPGDTVRPVLPAGLTFDAARVFLLP